MIPHRMLEDGVRQSRKPLGVEYAVGRWTRRTVAAGEQAIPLQDSYVVAPLYTGSRSLPKAQEEAAFITATFKPGDQIDPASYESLDEKLRTARSLVHFACHGEVKAAGRQLLVLDNNKELTALDLGGLDGIAEGFAAKRPFVFLNACQVGRLTPGLVGAGGLAQAFIDLGARAVVAPMWSVKDAIAHEIAMAFYQAAKAGTPFSEILKEIRAKAYDPSVAEDTYAAYCFYGDPLAGPVRRN
jgi:CHAT domain-containing protein